MTKRGVTVFCARPRSTGCLFLKTCRHMIFPGCEGLPRQGAPQSGSHQSLEGIHRKDHLRRLWADRVHNPVGNYFFMDVKPGSMGMPVPDLKIDILDEDFKHAMPARSAISASRPIRNDPSGYSKNISRTRKKMRRCSSTDGIRPETRHTLIPTDTTILSAVVMISSRHPDTASGRSRSRACSRSIQQLRKTRLSRA